MFFRIHPEAILRAVIPRKGAVFMLPAKVSHIIAVVQGHLILTQPVDDRIKLGFELVCFPLRPVIKPSGIKTIAGVGKVATEMPDISRLPADLRTLGIGVFLFG